MKYSALFSSTYITKQRLLFVIIGLLSFSAISLSQVTPVSCPSGNDGAITPNNIPTAVVLNSTQSQYVNLGRPLLNNLTAFTMEGWVYLTSKDKSIFGQNDVIEFGFGNGGKIEVYAQAMGKGISVSSTNITTNSWHHLAVTGSGNTITLFLNGTQFATYTHNRTITGFGSSAYNTNIGANVFDAAGGFSNLNVLKFGVWNRALSAAELLSLAAYPKTYTADQSGLIAGFNFNETSGSSVSCVPVATPGTLQGTTLPARSDAGMTYNWSRTSGGFSATTRNVTGLTVDTYSLVTTFNSNVINTTAYEVNALGIESTAPTAINGNAQIIAGTPTTLTLSGGSLGTGAQWVWYTNSCGGTQVGTGTSIQVNPIVTTTYYVRAEGNCNITTCASLSVEVLQVNAWLGTVSSDWNVSDNWSNGVPDITNDVHIHADAPYQPVVGIGGGACKSLSIASEATVTLGTADTLKVAGDWTNNGVFNAGTGVVKLMGEELQTLPSQLFHHLVVANSTAVILEKTAFVQVTGVLTVNKGKIIISTASCLDAQLINNTVGVNGIHIKAANGHPNGTLIFRNPVGSSVEATIEMYSKAESVNKNPFSNYKWQFFGIPLRTTTASPTFNGSYLRVYDETKLKPASQWANLANGSLLEAFKAYEITQNSPKTLTFKGELVNENKTIQLTYTEGGNYPGQNLLANPYTVALRIGNMSFGPATEATIYLYNTGSISDWQVGGSGGVGANPGQYVAVPKNIAASENPPTGLPLEIPTMQAFLLKKLRLNTDSLEHFYVNLDYSTMTANNTNPQRIRKEETVEPNPFTSIEVKGARYSDKMWIFTVEGCSRGFDNGWDGPKMWGGAAAPQIYAAEEDGNYQVNSVDDIDESYLGFRPGEDSFYSLTFTHDHLSGKSKQGIYLVDLLTSEITDITASPSVVQFNAEPMSLATKRFKIVTGRNPRVIEKKQESKVEILNISGKLFIDNKSGIVGKVVIHNLNGLPVYGDTFKGMGRTPINTKLKQGVYTVTASTTQETVTQTVVLEK